MSSTTTSDLFHLVIKMIAAKMNFEVTTNYNKTT